MALTLIHRKWKKGDKQPVSECLMSQNNFKKQNLATIP